jgi:acetylornithine deacetylase/succinyl-diaminopimelate desuccinylase-like protein
MVFSPTDIDWSTIQEEVVGHLANLIRIDTSNPPGNETQAAVYLRDVLADEGIDSTILEMAPGRGSLVARISGSGELEPLLLLSHLDVVPADEAGWVYPPFSAAIADGMIWGRGAIDMKHIVAAMLMALITAKRVGLPLRRDLIFAATADEESSGESGAGWLFRTHGNLVGCGLCVTEGPSTLDFNDSTYLLVEIGQKGWQTVDIVRRSPSRHSSIPTRVNCLLTIGELLHRLGTTRFPHHVPYSTRVFIECLAAEESAVRRELLALLEPTTFEVALADLACSEGTKLHLEALFHNHASPTLVQGGESTWAVPEHVTLRLAGRILPGIAEEDWLAELQGVIGSLGEHILEPFDAGVEAAASSQFFGELAAIVRRHNPTYKVLPALATGGGDVRYPLLAGAEAIGFFPLTPERGIPGVMELAHSQNERISVGNLVRCVRYAWDVICVSNGLPLAPL